MSLKQIKEHLDRSDWEVLGQKKLIDEKIEELNP